jgi:hypothetical protein
LMPPLVLVAAASRLAAWPIRDVSKKLDEG